MHTVTKEDVARVANLSKLTITEVETEKFQKQLSEIVTHIDKIATLNTNPSNEHLDSPTLNQMRVDSIDEENKLTVDQSLLNTKSKKSGMFEVGYVFSQTDES
jgi:aspartyl/glutamyl-tRNA(Asn/Gln) amidotransferase C subunit